MDQLELMKKAIDAKRAKNAEKQPRYGMRKLSVGLVSCLIGTLIFTPGMGVVPSQSFAATTVKTVSEQRVEADADGLATKEKTKQATPSESDKNAKGTGKDISVLDAVKQSQSNAGEQASNQSKAGTEAAIGSGEVSELLAKARKAIGTRNVLRGPQAPASNGNLPANIVDKNNWDKNMSMADSYFPFNQEVGITPNQRPIRVTTSDPIEMWDVNYMGWFVDAEGRTNLRLTYNENSVVVSAVWHTALFKFDPELFDAVDWDKSYATITDDGEVKVKFTDSNQANAKRLDVKEAIKSRTNRKNNVPINLVLKDGVTLDSLPKKNLMIQMRLLDKNFERLYAFAPKGTSIDYSTHTKSTIIPMKSDIDSYFMRGNRPNGNLFVEQRAFMSEFIANPDRYDDSSDIGVIRTEYQRAHENKAKANTYEGKPIGFVQVFDAELVQFLKEDSQGNIAFTSLLNRDRTERKGNASYPYNQYGIKKNQINYTPDGKLAYIVLAENNFEANGVNVVRVEKLDGSVYEGTGGFTCIDYNVDKTKLREAFETPGTETNQVRFGTMSGWIDANPKGWSTFKIDFDKELKIQEGESFIIDTGAKPEGGTIAFQVGAENSLLRKMVGNYMAARGVGAKDGIGKIEELGDGLYKIHLREGATIKKGDAVRLFMPDTENHDKKVFFMGITNATKVNEGGATLSVNKDRNIDLHLAYKADKCEFIYTPAGSTETKTVTFTKGVTWKNDAPRGLIKGIPNTAILATGGNYVIDATKLEPGQPVIAKAYAGDKVYESQISYVPLEKGEKYTRMAIADNTDTLSSIVVGKSMYVPYQDIFTNDYADGRGEIYEDSKLLPESEEKFMTDTTSLEGYSKYDSGIIRARYITEKGTTLVGKATADGNEYNDNGDIVKAAEKEVSIDGKKYTAFEYNLSLKDFSELKSGEGTPIKLLKDMRFIFNSSDGSSLPSDWISQRVKTRVLFNATLGTLDDGKDKSVKIVPDNVKYYGEEGYTPNGFVGATANANTGDKFEKNPTAPAGKTFLGWVTESGLDKLKGQTTRSVPAGYTEDDFVTTSEKFNALTKDTDVFTENTPVTSHQVVYAVYTAEKIITFDANGGKFEGDKTQVTEDISDGVTEPKAPTKEGKTFKGWATKADATAPDVTDLSKVAEGTTLYAVWADAPAESNADKYQPEYSGMTVKQGETATVEPTFKDNAGQAVDKTTVPVSKYELGAGAPKGASIDDKTGKVTYTAPANQPAGDVTIPVVVSYADGTTDNATAKATVSAAAPAESSADKFQPEYSGMTVKQGETAMANPTFKDKAGQPVDKTTVPVAKYELGAGAPQGASIDPTTGVVTYAAPADQPAGEVTIPVVVKYEDGTEDTATAKATVSAAAPVDSNADNYQPEYSGMTVKQGETATANPTFKDKAGQPVDKATVPVAKYELGADAPEGASIDPTTGVVTYTAPANQPAGDVTIPVVVSYADGTTDNATAKATVSAKTPAESNADKYQPEYSGMTVKQGETATANPTFKDKAGQPVDKATVPVAKYELGADAPQGASIDPTTGVVTYTAPANQPAGEVTIPVVVKYADGTTDNATAKATVSATTPAESNADKYQPEYSGMTVKQGETATANPTFKDKAGQPVDKTTVPVAKYELGADAPKGASIDDKTGKVTYAAPADQPAGEVTIPVVVKYEDGTEDTATAKATVSAAAPADSNADKYQPEYSGMTVKQGETATVEPTFKDKAGQPVNKADVPVAKYELGPNAPKGASIDAKTGKVTYAAPADQAEGDVTIPVVVKYEDGTEDTATAKATVSAKTPADTTPPSAPKVEAKDDGSIEVTPPADADTKTVEITYTPEGSDKPVTVIATKDANGTWSVPDGSDVTIDPQTGKVTIPENMVKDGTEVVAVAKDEAGNASDEAKATSKDVNAPAAPKVEAKDDGSIEVTPPADADTKTVEITYTPEGSDKPVTVIATKDANGTWSVPDGSDVTIDPQTGKVTIPENMVKDGTEVVAVAKDEAGNASDEAKATSKDVNAPAAPKVEAKDDGSIEVTPPADADTKTVEITYTPEGSDKPVTVIATKDANRTWSVPDGSDVTIDPQTGKVTIPENKVKDGTEVVAVAKDEAGNKSDEAKATSKDVNGPSAPKVDAKDDGSIEVTPPADADTKTLEITYTPEGSDQPVTVIATKDANGTWSVPDGSDVTIDPQTGKVTIPENKVKDGTEVVAVAKDEAGNASDEAKATSKDVNGPAAPKVDAKDDGSIEVTPPADADTKTLEITYTPEGTDKPVTVIATKDANGTWSVPDGSDVTIDPQTGKVTIPENKVKDGTEVVAVAKDEAGNASDEAKTESLAKLEVEVKSPSVTEGEKVKDGTKVVIPNKDNAKIIASEEVNGLKVDDNGNLVGTPKISDWGKTEETRVIRIPVTIKTDLETLETFIEVTVNRDTDGDGIPDIIDEDDDNDGVSDVQEAKDGTDSKDANSKLAKNNSNDKKNPKTSDSNGMTAASTTLLGSLIALATLRRRKDSTK